MATVMTEKRTVRAWAKINWFLEIQGLRPDGYHRVRTLLQSLDLSDELEISSCEDGAVSEFEKKVLHGRNPIHLKGQNLAYTAAQALKNKYGVALEARISIRKHIPLGAGLGGGSADAAATLLALREIWGLSLSEDNLQPIAASLGSDVPFCLSGGLALAEGRGESLQRLPDIPVQHLLLLKPSFPVSTPWAYARWDEVGGGALTSPRTGEILENLLQALREGRASQIARYLHNDLERAVVPSFPEIQEMKEALLGHGALGALMSGSGSVVFGLFEGREEALVAAEALKGGRWEVFPVQTTGRRPI